MVAWSPGSPGRFGRGIGEPLSHAVTIRERYGYTAFGEGPVPWRFLRWLFEPVWTEDDRPTVLIDLATECRGLSGLPTGTVWRHSTSSISPACRAV